MGPQWGLLRHAHRIRLEIQLSETMNRFARVLVPLLVSVLILSILAMPVLAGNHSNARDRVANVAQKPPSAGAPDLTSDDDDAGTAGVQVQPTAGSTRAVSVQSTIQDDNGHNDIDSVAVTVYESDQTTVHISPAAASKSSGNGRNAVYSITIDMAFHDPPGTYHVKIEATDRDGQTDTSWGQFTYEELAGVDPGTETVSLNPDGDSNTAISPGDDTRDNPSQVTITNSGNVPIDVDLSGTDLDNADSSASIAVGNIVYSDSNTFTTETALSTTATTYSLNLSPGASSSATIYFAADIPEGTPADTYQGTMTLSAVKAS